LIWENLCQLSFVLLQSRWHFFHYTYEYEHYIIHTDISQYIRIIQSSYNCIVLRIFFLMSTPYNLSWFT
jgi:hypothetical protein